jgi:hypothetical protein
VPARQLRLKDIAGRALLHTDAANGLAALVIPVRVPPRLYRLDDKLRRGEDDPNGAALTVVHSPDPARPLSL